MRKVASYVTLLKYTISMTLIKLSIDLPNSLETAGMVSKHVHSFKRYLK